MGFENFLATDDVFHLYTVALTTNQYFYVIFGVFILSSIKLFLSVFQFLFENIAKIILFVFIASLLYYYWDDINTYFQLTETANNTQNSIMYDIQQKVNKFMDKLFTYD